MKAQRINYLICFFYISAIIVLRFIVGPNWLPNVGYAFIAPLFVVFNNAKGIVSNKKMITYTTIGLLISVLLRTELDSCLLFSSFLSIIVGVVLSFFMLKLNK